MNRLHNNSDTLLKTLVTAYEVGCYFRGRPGQLGQNVILACEDKFIFSFHWIENWSSCGHALEQLEFSGTKIMMNGPIVCQL